MAQVQLTWSDYLTSVSNSYIRHRAQDMFTDVTLVTDDNHQVSAHRIILCAGSEYFRKILEEKKHPHPMLCLEGISSGDLNIILDYIYMGELLIPESSLTSFLKIATRLKCSGLNSDIKSIKEDPNIIEKVEDENESFLEDDDVDIIITEAEITQPQLNLTKIEDDGVIEKEDGTFEFTKSSTEINLEGNLVQDSPVDFGNIAENTENVPSEKSQRGSPEKDFNNTNETLDMSPQYCRVEGKIYSYIELKEMKKRLFEQKEKGWLRCKYCNYKAKYTSHIMIHVEIHINNLEFDCSCCDKVFTTMEQLRAHIYRRKMKKEGNRQPLQAAKDVEDKAFKEGKHFIKANYLEEDYRNESVKDRKLSKYQPPGGGKTLAPKFCKIEGKTFSFQELRQMTKKLYSQQSNGEFQCNFCPKITSINNHMMEHTQKHIDNLEFESFCCGAKYSTTPCLRDHQLKCNKNKRKKLERSYSKIGHDVGKII